MKSFTPEHIEKFTPKLLDATQATCPDTAQLATPDDESGSISPELEFSK